MLRSNAHGFRVDLQSMIDTRTSCLSATIEWSSGYVGLSKQSLVRHHIIRKQACVHETSSCQTSGQAWLFSSVVSARND
jgi:hypothetical protein